MFQYVEMELLLTNMNNVMMEMIFHMMVVMDVFFNVKYNVDCVMKENVMNVQN